MSVMRCKKCESNIDTDKTDFDYLFELCIPCLMERQRDLEGSMGEIQRALKTLDKEASCLNTLGLKGAGRELDRAVLHANNISLPCVVSAIAKIQKVNSDRDFTRDVKADLCPKDCVNQGGQCEKGCDEYLKAIAEMGNIE